MNNYRVTFMNPILGWATSPNHDDFVLFLGRELMLDTIFDSNRYTLWATLFRGFNILDNCNLASVNRWNSFLDMLRGKRMFNTISDNESSPTFPFQ